MNVNKAINAVTRRGINWMATAIALAAVSVTGAAQTMSSTAELKLACETSPGNVVTLNQNTQISTGPAAPLAEIVNTRCTIVVAPQVTFEASQVSMTFSGPLTIQAGNEGRALFLESSFVAPSVSVSLANLGGLLVERSLLRASVGSLAISSGVENFVDVRGPLVGGGLVANRSISISGGQKFLGSLTDAEVRAGTGIAVNMTGAEAQFISTNSLINTTGGAININSNGEKSFVEFKLGAVATGRAGVNVNLLGAESTINANEFTLSSAAGAVNLRTGASKGAITLALGTITAGTAANIQASLTGSEGKALLQNANVAAAGAIRIETGALGNTEAIDNSLVSNTLVRILGGAGGTCKSQNNIINAPTQQICL